MWTWTILAVMLLLKPEEEEIVEHSAFACRPNRLHVTTHSHELMSLVSIYCVNNIKCLYWSGSHSLSATHCPPRVLSDLFLGQCHQLPLLLPLGLHLNNLKPLSATVVALIRSISHLNIKICKLLSLKLQIKQIRVVYSHLKLWVKVVRHNSKFVKI